MFLEYIILIKSIDAKVPCISQNNKRVLLLNTGFFFFDLTKG